MMYFSILVVSLIIMAIYTLYLEYQLNKLRKNLTRVATTLYDLVLVLNNKNVIQIVEEDEDE